MSELRVGMPIEAREAAERGELEPLLERTRDMSTVLLGHVTRQVGALGPLAPVALKLIVFAVAQVSEALRAEYPATVHAKEATFTGFEKA